MPENSKSHARRSDPFYRVIENRATELDKKILHDIENRSRRSIKALVEEYGFTSNRIAELFLYKDPPTYKDCLTFAAILAKEEKYSSLWSKFSEEMWPCGHQRPPYVLTRKNQDAISVSLENSIDMGLKYKLITDPYGYAPGLRADLIKGERDNSKDISENNRDLHSHPGLEFLYVEDGVVEFSFIDVNVETTIGRGQLKVPALSVKLPPKSWVFFPGHIPHRLDYSADAKTVSTFWDSAGFSRLLHQTTDAIHYTLTRRTDVFKPNEDNLYDLSEIMMIVLAQRLRQLKGQMLRNPIPRKPPGQAKNVKHAERESDFDATVIQRLEQGLTGLDPDRMRVQRIIEGTYDAYFNEWELHKPVFGTLDAGLIPIRWEGVPHNTIVNEDDSEDKDERGGVCIRINPMDPDQRGEHKSLIRDKTLQPHALGANSRDPLQPMLVHYRQVPSAKLEDLYLDCHPGFELVYVLEGEIIFYWLPTRVVKESKHNKMALFREEELAEIVAAEFLPAVRTIKLSEAKELSDFEVSIVQEDGLHANKTMMHPRRITELTVYAQKLVPGDSLVIDSANVYHALVGATNNTNAALVMLLRPSI